MLFRSAWLVDPRAGLDGPPTCWSATGRSPRSAPPGAIDAPTEREVVDAEGLHVFPGLRRPARAPAHARPRGRGGPRVRHPGRRRRRASAACSRCRTPTRSSTPRRCCASLQERAAREALVPVGFLASITRGLAGRGAHRDDGAGARGRRRLHRRRRAGRRRAAHAPGASVPAARAARVLALHEEDPALSGAGVMHEGAVSTLLGLAGIPSISESTRSSATSRWRATRAGASTSCTSRPRSRWRRSSGPSDEASR